MHLARLPRPISPAFLKTAALDTGAAVLGVLLAMAGGEFLQGLTGHEWPLLLAVPMVALLALCRGLATATVALLACIAWYVRPALGASAAFSEAPWRVALFALAAVGAILAAAAVRNRRRIASGQDALLWLEYAALLALVVPFVLFVTAALHTRNTTLAESRVHVERLVRTAHEHALKVFETNEVLIGRINDQMAGLSNAQIRARSAELQGVLERMVSALPQVHAVWLVDEQGRAVANSRVALPQRVYADYPWFAGHRGERGALLIAAPRIGAGSGQVFFEVSRRREAADGSFLGAIVVALNPNYFRDFYREVSPTRAGITHTLLHQNGAVLARWPTDLKPGEGLSAASPIRKAMGGGASSGTLHSSSTVDGRPRLAAYRRVGPYSTYVHAGFDEEVALANWRRETLMLAGFVLPLAVILCLATLAALRRTRQNIAMAQQLQRESIERHKVEAALHHSQKLEALGYLTGGVAHDFNNLLMVVNMNATILARPAGQHLAPRAIEAIQNAVKAGSKLTRQLVAFTRRQPLLPQPVDFAQRLAADAELLKTLLGRDVVLHTHVEPGTPAVLVDPSELELALMNLAINAKHAMPQGGKATLDVRATPAAGSAPAMVTVTFSDTGSGIAPADLARVFEPFFTTKGVGKGTGLGLSQVQGLCQRAGGSVEIASTPGVGTSVRLRFPALAADPAQAPAGPAAADPVASIPARVLMVEDNLEVATATLDLLQVLGCRATHCERADQALALLAPGHGFDLVLSDVVTPGAIDGIELARQVAAREPHLPVILMTGYAERIPEAERLRVRVLPKPFDAATLAAHLREMLARGVQAAG